MPGRQAAGGGPWARPAASQHGHARGLQLGKAASPRACLLVGRNTRGVRSPRRLPRQPWGPRAASHNASGPAWLLAALTPPSERAGCGFFPSWVPWHIVGTPKKTVRRGTTTKGADRQTAACGRSPRGSQALVESPPLVISPLTRKLDEQAGRHHSIPGQGLWLVRGSQLL